MKLSNIKKRYIVLIFLFLLGGSAGTAHSKLSITNCPPTNTATVGTLYSYPFASDSPGYTWSISSGTTPNLTINASTGVLSGTPNTPGTYNFTIYYYRNPGNQDSCASTITVAAPGCSFPGTDTGAILFDIDPTSAGPIYNSITTPVNFRCDSGVQYSISYTSSQTLSGTNNSIPFTLVLAADGTSTSSIMDIPLLTTNSWIDKINYQNAYAETDNNTTTVTINWTGNTGSPIYATVNAVAVVQDICSNTGSPSLNFGTLDAITNASGAVATVTPPSLMCTMGSSVTVTSDGGLNFSGTSRLRDSSMNYINYNLSFSGSLSGAGGSTDIGGSGAGRLALSATIPAGGLDNAPAGTYTDTVTLTISY